MKKRKRNAINRNLEEIKIFFNASLKKYLKRLHNKKEKILLCIYFIILLLYFL